jgi:hypothetical protein
MGIDIIAIGEPLLEFNSEEEGSLSEVRHFVVGWGGDTSNFSIAASRLGGSVGYLLIPAVLQETQTLLRGFISSQGKARTISSHIIEKILLQAV